MLAHSLPAAAAQDGAEVVVIDNACTDGTPDLAERHGAQLVKLYPRVSYAQAINAGLARTGGDAVLLLNADCFLDPGFLAAARPRLQERGVGIVAPRLRRTLGPEPEQTLDEIDAAAMTIDRRRKNGLVGHGEPAQAYDERGDCFGADGAAALYRREALEHCAVGAEVFDEDMALWASDADVAWRLRLLGWRCAYEPSATGRHIRTYSPSTRWDMSEEARRVQFRNRLLMIAKNETFASFIRDAHRILLYELLALGHVLLRERHLLGGYSEAFSMLKGARRRRRTIQARRAKGVRIPFGLEPPR
jgi:GT2 family glycosyltransferase